MNQSSLSKPHPFSLALLPASMAISSMIVFFLLHHLGLPGGDTKVILAQSSSYLWDPKWVYYSREPLAHGLAHGLYLLVGDHHMAFSILGSLCGGLYIAVLTGFSRHPLFLAVNLLGVGTLNFIGHIEYYAPLMVSLTFYFLLLFRALDPGSKVQPIHVVLAFILSYFCHKLTLFYAPAMLWLVVDRVEGRWRLSRWPGRQAEWGLTALIAMAGLDLLPGLIYQYNFAPFHILYVYTNEGLLDWLTPLTPAIARALEARSETGMFYLYTIGQPRHWMFFFGFLAMGAPVGLPLLVALRRKIQSNRSNYALMSASLIGIGWVFVWHPRVMWLDWDLFAMAAIPVNLLAGLVLVNRQALTKPRESPSSY